MKASQVLSLDASDWRVMLCAGFLIPAHWLAVRNGWHRASSWPLQPGAREGLRSDLQTAARIGKLVNATASRMPWRVTCLVRSLVVLSLLERRKLDGRLRIGVRTVGGQLQAHAWVEHGGVPVNDHRRIAEEFAPFEGKLSSQSFSSP